MATTDIPSFFFLMVYLLKQQKEMDREQLTIPS